MGLFHNKNSAGRRKRILEDRIQGDLDRDSNRSPPCCCLCPCKKILSRFVEYYQGYTPCTCNYSELLTPGQLQRFLVLIAISEYYLNFDFSDNKRISFKYENIPERRVTPHRCLPEKPASFREHVQGKLRNVLNKLIFLFKVQKLDQSYLRVFRWESYRFRSS